MSSSTPRRSPLYLLASLLLAVCLPGCLFGGDGKNSGTKSEGSTAVQIASVSPASGPSGSAVTVSGQGFQAGAQVALCASSARVVARAPEPGARAVAVQDGYALLGTTGGELLAVDVSDPTGPAVLDRLGVAAADIVVDGYLAYAGGEGTLSVISLADPAAPYAVGSCKLPGSCLSLALADGNLYAACSGAGLKLIDVTDPRRPQVIGSRATPDPATGVAVNGDKAFVTTSAGELIIYKKGDKDGKPTFKALGTCELGAPAWGVALSGKYAYVAAGEAGLLVVDVGTPKEPQIMGTCHLPGCARGVVVSGMLVYVPCDIAGLQIVNVDKAGSPRLTQSCATPGACLDVALSGTYAFLADRDYGWLHAEAAEPVTGLVAVALGSPSLAFEGAALVNSSKMTAVVPETGPLGAWDVQVTNPDGKTAVLPSAFVVGAENRPLNPTLLGPADQAADLPPEGALSWTCGASRADNRFVYAVGITIDPEAAGQSLTVGTPELDLADLRAPEFLLSPETTYYWSVTVKDAYGWGSTGPTWSFTTGSYPFIKSLSPASCAQDGELTIQGSGLNTGGADWVLLGDKKIKPDAASITSWTDTEIKLNVPLKYPKSTPKGQTVDVDVQVSVGGKVSNIGHFALLPAAAP